MNERCDLLVVGGGVMGLWAARHAIAAGLDVIVIDSARCGHGASGGILGALMPHMPTGWSKKKQFQFDALAELPGEVARLEAETGYATGFARTGRIVPVRTERFLAEADRRVAASAASWPGFGHAVRQPGSAAPWFDSAAAPLGLLHDDLSARIAPRAYLEALAASVSRAGRVYANWAFAGYNPERGLAHARNGDTIAAGHMLIAAGYASFPLLARLHRSPAGAGNLGGGVKGQAALLACDGYENSPIIYDDGVYIVPHGAGRVAVGSTTEKTWDDPNATDARLEALIERARELCPPLRKAPVLERWAGIRPKSAATDPIAGRWPDDDRLSVATGGYKISFGIAHRLTKHVIAEVAGEPEAAGLPDAFTVPHHLNAASARRA